MGGESEMSYELDDMPGVVTVAEWTMAPDGARYRHFWSDKWRVVPDKDMPVEGFKSSEKWTLFGLRGDRVVLAVPGCQVKGWYRCHNPPKLVAEGAQCYRLTADVV